MKCLCVIENDGKITLPNVILQQLPTGKRCFVELEFSEDCGEKLKLNEINPFKEEGIPIPYDALEESDLINEGYLRMLVMDRAVLITCEDKILEMMAGECFR